MAVLQMVAVPFPPFLTPPGYPGGEGRGRYKLPTSIAARRHNLSLGGLAGHCEIGWSLWSWLVTELYSNQEKMIQIITILKEN
jgi:hypothetical protein